MNNSLNFYTSKSEGDNKQLLFLVKSLARQASNADYKNQAEELL